VGGKIVGGYKFRYHAAITGQLLGLRLWHADFLLFAPYEKSLDAARVDLPTDDLTGNYILGRGEKKPKVFDNRIRLAALQTVMAEKRRSVKWDTYVITDKDRPVSFAVEGGKLVLKGTPIWWFYSSDRLGGVVPHLKFSQAITAVIEENGGINPPVYSALVKTMRYSALFRHIKSERPQVWAAFAKDVHSRNLGMPADTPGLVELLGPLP
jgi:hypothetical protein